MPALPVSTFAALGSPMILTMSVSVASEAVCVAVMVSWLVPLTVVSVAGLNVAVSPGESPFAVSVSGAVEVVVRENVTVAGTLNPCLATIGFGEMETFIGRICAGPLAPSPEASPPHVIPKTTLNNSKAWRMRDPP